ncbi:hypothetical protein AVEN_63760-1 [Araneus ventricosus]|uniref:Uncharacterized protein n=1 Tax=Araneus ventricosus TaxID=182803 RepID=A0A4Y2V9B5_ARAVE|nr:hypothetical protein AVEN_63760-1 [Araneus ventricosus]
MLAHTATSRKQLSSRTHQLSSTAITTLVTNSRFGHCGRRDTTLITSGTCDGPSDRALIMNSSTLIKGNYNSHQRQLQLSSRIANSDTVANTLQLSLRAAHATAPQTEVRPDIKVEVLQPHTFIVPTKE